MHMSCSTSSTTSSVFRAPRTPETWGGIQTGKWSWSSPLSCQTTTSRAWRSTTTTSSRLSNRTKNNHCNERQEILMEENLQLFETEVNPHETRDRFFRLIIGTAAGFIAGRAA